MDLHELARTYMRQDETGRLQIPLDLFVHSGEEKLVRVEADAGLFAGELHHMRDARRLARIDELALRLEHLEVGTRYHQGAINPPKHAIERFGSRHIAFDEFDVWQLRERDSLRPIAHQRTHRYAVTREFTYDRRAIQAGSAGYQDHVHLPSLRVQWRRAPSC